MSDAKILFDRALNTLYGTWHEFLFSLDTDEVIVMAYGNWREVDRPLVRINSSCLSAQYLASVECDCREQLAIAYERIVAAGGGLVVLLEQDGRGNGHLALMRAAAVSKQVECTQGEAYESLGYSADARSYGCAVAAIHALGVRSVTLMTNNPAKLSAFAEGGIEAVPMQVIVPNTDSRSLDRYYELKAHEGHDTSK